MKISKEELKQIIVEEAKKAMDDPALKELRNIPVGGGKAATCEEAGRAAGAAYAKDNPDIAKSIVRISVQQAGAKKQLKGKHSAMLDIAAKQAMESQGYRVCTEGPEGMRAMDAFRDAFLEVANEEHAMGFASATGPTSRAQLPRRGPNAPIPGEPRMAAETLTREIVKALQEVAKQD